MKKLLVVLLALTFVLAMANYTFAVATTSVDGKVEWTLTNTEQFGGTDDGEIHFDLTKDYGEGYSAGVTIFVDPDNTPTVGWDCDGWIKMVKDFGTLTFQTGGLGGNAANELGGEYDMTGAAGVKLESTSLVDGLSLTVVLNDTFKTAPDPVNDGNYANYLIKGVYTADALTIGAGLQSHTVPTGITNSTEKDMMAVWAGYKLSDALSFGLEYASRPNVDGLDTSFNLVEGSTAILVKADYNAAPFTVSGKVQVQTGTYITIAAGDVGNVSAWNIFKFGVAGTALKIDAGYQITDAMKATLTVEDMLDGASIIGFKVDSDWLMSYKLDLTDALSDQLSVEAWYAGYNTNTEIGLKATYTFIAGLVGSLELKSTDAEGTDPVNSYTAKLTATL